LEVYMALQSQHRLVPIPSNKQAFHKQQGTAKNAVPQFCNKSTKVIPVKVLIAFPARPCRIRDCVNRILLHALGSVSRLAWESPGDVLKNLTNACWLDIFLPCQEPLELTFRTCSNM
jgi:hypothetical protein